jgi:K+-transporting ATPase ATPase C chain
MKKQALIAVIYTLITAVLLGIVYPVAIYGISQVFFRDKANGQLLSRNGQLIGSRIIGQTFTGPGYFHGRPSAAGAGYDASASSGSNLGPTNKTLIDRVNASTTTEGDTDVPIDLVTTSGSGLDPDITPAAAFYQVERVAAERHLSSSIVRKLVEDHVTQRQLGLLGEPRVNVLELNLSLENLSAPAL